MKYSFLFLNKNILLVLIRGEVFLMSTHNVSFCCEVRKMSVLYSWKYARPRSMEYIKEQQRL